ncbi:MULTISPECIES: aspartate aminotransferase family protein [unclassified Pseudomonas]|uniref:aspartate aminotransferase family protein n=1 Tax=unclassified Pseudomonas TaxID=196821 RepID=UPI000C87E281|nr:MULTISPECIES: aspartate aminotransferase family protein [unclassified Pseudomonas]PNA01139.1 aspartate aminotransferase family protein [Pseudomonas sp. FW305-42]PNA25883.1 aspartate aminotransferase family protein [Pseudomonas sp. MPR-R1B]PNB28007.1 aspartate aminotransferase family protein [Pseudomonas sp. DP16D-E2]PNB44934.1 aspartate aminotransferase family protein [Pseudomonas sp. FW305-17]PNB64014.1 aspartate aminotransferase family protein [Pseudomonas sp. GW531-E2]
MNTLTATARNDLAALIHPNTNLAQHQEIGPLVITAGDGVRVFDEQGNAYIEAMSGLWSVALGFSEQRLVDAAVEQLRQLPYYHSFSHKTNAPAAALAAKLAELAPGDLNHVFFTNSGSEANDSVVKMVWYVNNVLGKPAKKKFISRQQAYHGATVACASLSGIPSMHRDFDLPAIPVHHLTCPNFYRFARPGETEEAFSARLADELEHYILDEGPETIAAFIGEPVMAAGGVIPPPQGYWAAIQAVCRRYDILVVIDEIITGFGRLGTMFGAELYGIQPDIMVLSKQLTSSYQPLAAVLVSDAIHDVLLSQSQRLGAFAHGLTCTGHPVATAVALENIRIIEERDLVGQVQRLAPEFQRRLRAFADHPLVGDVRGVGLVGAIELVANKATGQPFAQPGTLGGYVFKQAHKHGLIIRAIYDTIAFCPPLICTQADIEAIFGAFERTLADATEWAHAQNLM